MPTPGDIFAELRERGLLAQYSQKGDLPEHLRAARSLYCGFDPTASSLHVGSLTPLFTLFRFALCGHRPIVLLGGGTGLIGDPSFRPDERALQSSEQTAEYCAAIRRQCQHILDNFRNSSIPGAADCSLQFENNLEWLSEYSLIGFLRDVGKFFSVNTMIGKESVRRRLAEERSGISFTEFSYMLLQACDFRELYRRCACTVQIGGSDQWGNITQGIELIRRSDSVDAVNAADSDHVAQAYALTLPLLVRADGGKFGKTETGTVWLGAGHTSPYSFYQFWINSADRDLPQYELFFSFRPQPELGHPTADEDASALRRRKQALARELTTLVHGSSEMQRAERISTLLFSDAVTEFSREDFQQLALDGMDKSECGGESIDLAEALVKTDLARNPRGQSTLKQAREFVRVGAVAVNGRSQRDESAVLHRSEALFGSWHLLRRGKKQFHLLCWTDD